MGEAKEKAKRLAKKIMQAMKEAKDAEARAIRLGKKMAMALKAAKKEAREEARARTVVKYPAGRYECAQCGFSCMFTVETTDLPECDNCGSTKYKGHEPQVFKVEPPKPKKYPAGMYKCDYCNVLVAVGEDTNEMSECEFCGETGVTPVD